MSCNVGNTIQRILNNSPSTIAVNETSSAISTLGGEVYIAGLVQGRVQPCFDSGIFNNDAIGSVKAVKAAFGKYYLLSEKGYVFEFNYNLGDCGPAFRVIYCPADCCGDKAISIASGSKHVVILTEKNKVYGAGDNSEYQIVPQGQCNYECATEMIITDINNHDSCCCDEFNGFIRVNDYPVPSQCALPFNFSASFYCKNFDTLSFGGKLPHFSDGTFTATFQKDSTHKINFITTLNFPVYADYTVAIRNGVVDNCGNLNGCIEVTFHDIYIGGRRCKFSGKKIRKPYFDLTDAKNEGIDSLPDTQKIGQFPRLSLLSSTSLPPREKTIVLPIPDGTNVYKCVNSLGSGEPGFTFPIILSAKNGAGSPFSGQYDIGNSVIYQLMFGNTTITNILNFSLVYDTEANPPFQYFEIASQYQRDWVISNENNLPYTILPNLIFNFGKITTSTPYGHFNATNNMEPIDVKVPCNCIKKLSTDVCCGKQFDNCCPIPQPCWKAVYAGYTNSALVDSCNRIYVFGSLHRVRSNKRLLKKNCLEQLLSQTEATIALPADELNCCLRPKTDNCQCNKCKEKCFKTDLSRFGITLSFPTTYKQTEDNSTPGTFVPVPSKINVCDFLKALQNCNDYPGCDSTCEPCDNTVYINICSDPACNSCTGSKTALVGSIVLYNKKSVCRCISSFGSCNGCNGNQRSGGKQRFDSCFNTIVISVNVNTLVEINQNNYCIDGVMVPLDNIVILQIDDIISKFSDAYSVPLYVDSCRLLGIRLFSCTSNCNANPLNKSFTVEYPVNIADLTNGDINTALEFGKLLDPLELANFKLSLGMSCGFFCPCYRNPAPNKLYMAYLNGGDRVRFVTTNNVIRGSTFPGCNQTSKGIGRFPVTADIPTVFSLQKPIYDMAIGPNNLSVLTGTVQCPNEIMAIGQNCFGELGLGNNENQLCFQKVNRCLFDCQVERIFAGPTVTFYITHSSRVYTAGKWKCIGNSNIPIALNSVCQSWKISQIAISNTHVLLLGRDGGLFGFGDNSLGELGLCHTKCVVIPTPLCFLDKLNQGFLRQFKGFYNPYRLRSSVFAEDPQYQPCTPVPGFCEIETRNCCKKSICQDSAVLNGTYNSCACDNILPKNDATSRKEDLRGKYTRRAYIANDRCCRSVD